MKKTISFSFLMSCALFIFSCSNGAVTEEVKSALETSANRSMSKALKFKSLAAFENGKCNLSIAELDALSNKDLSLIVFYDSEAEWANVFNSGVYEKTGDEGFNSLLSKYQLSIVEQSEFDEMSEMLVLEPNEKLNLPADAAKDISKISGVIMVHLKENKTETTETADND